MSRYAVESTTYEIFVGWDSPLQTFFAQVFTLPSEPLEGLEGDEEPIFWVGTVTGELSTVDELEEYLNVSGFCQFSEELRQNLKRDKEQEPFVERPVLLTDLMRLFKENISED